MRPPVSPNTVPAPHSTSRFGFIDAYRGWAVLVMIETHVVNALLRVPLKDESFFKALTFVNGLVAPSFLFCAGLGFAIVIQRRWQEFIALRRPFWRYIFRLVFILVVAYSLHLPFFSLQRMRAVTDQQLWTSFFQVDILQVIAITLIFLAFLSVVVRDQNRFIAIASIISLVIITVSPIVREMDLTNLPIWFRSFLTNRFKSQFPLFPWSAFLVCGVMIGYWFLRANRENTEPRVMKRLALLAAVGIVLALAAEALPFTLYPDHDFWRASPEFFFVRLGLVMLGCIGLWLYEKRHTFSGRSPITLFGQESLLVYTVHLLIVYGYTYEWSFIRKFGPTLNYLECLGLIAALTLAMYLLAFVWHWMKGWNKRVSNGVEFAILAGIVVWFVLKQ